MKSVLSVLVALLTATPSLAATHCTVGFEIDKDARVMKILKSKGYRAARSGETPDYTFSQVETVLQVMYEDGDCREEKSVMVAFHKGSESLKDDFIPYDNVVAKLLYGKRLKKFARSLPRCRD